MLCFQSSARVGCTGTKRTVLPLVSGNAAASTSTHATALLHGTTTSIRHVSMPQSAPALPLAARSNHRYDFWKRARAPGPPNLRAAAQSQLRSADKTSTQARVLDIAGPHVRAAPTVGRMACLCPAQRVLCRRCGVLAFQRTVAQRHHSCAAHQAGTSTCHNRAAPKCKDEGRTSWARSGAGPTRGGSGRTAAAPT